MGLRDDVHNAMQAQQDASHQRKITAFQTRTQEAERIQKATEQELRELQKEFSALSHLTSVSTEPRKLTVKPNSKSNRATPFLMLSDLHLDEVVNPMEVEGVNSYNREIATQRLHRTFESTIHITRDYWTGIKYDECVVLLGGDLFSGGIHDELKESNEDTMFGSMLYWNQQMLDGLGLLADTFGKVHVASVVGNHGRTTRKPRAKFRARDNFDWYFSMNLAVQLRQDRRFTFTIPESMDAVIPVYDKKIRMTHGDQTGGGSGIGGIWPPIMRLDARKRQRQAAVGNQHDYLVMGHWHQLVFGPQFIINGSLKGYDEYAYGSNFGFEPPAQALWLMAPEKGRTWMTPVYSQDRAKEGW